jgi:predicted phosphodiesterase
MTHEHLKRSHRRNFLAAGGTLLATNGAVLADEHNSAPSNPDRTGRGSVSVDGHHVRFYLSQIDQPVEVMIIADTHLDTDDERGVPYQPYSARMAAAFRETKHFQTGELTSPAQCFRESIQLARDSNLDLLALLGDIVSFPSEAAVEFVSGQLVQAGVPYMYVAGNHDWHYEGMEGSLVELRETWIERRLRPLYQGANPMASARDIHGIRFVFVDNSNYEITIEQLEFVQKQMQEKVPWVLLVHIPLYVRGRPVGFGCGHPEWGAATDRNFQLERRPQWPEGGHSATTMEFHQAVFASPHLLGIFAGHIHKPSADVVKGIPQFVTNYNATGAFMKASFLPVSPG